MAYQQYKRRSSVTIDGKSVDSDLVYRPDGESFGWWLIGGVLFCVACVWSWCGGFSH